MLIRMIHFRMVSGIVSFDPEKRSLGYSTSEKQLIGSRNGIRRRVRYASSDLIRRTVEQTVLMPHQHSKPSFETVRRKESGLHFVPQSHDSVCKQVRK